MSDRPFDESPPADDADLTRELPGARPGMPGGHHGPAGEGVPGGHHGPAGQGVPGGHHGAALPHEDHDPEADRPAWLVPLLAAVGALVVGVVLGWLLWSGGDDSSDLEAERDRLMTENAGLRDEVDSLTAELETLETDGADRLEELTAENEELSTQVDTLTGEVDSLTTDTEDLAGQVADLEEENAQLHERIEQILNDIDEAMVAAPDVVGGSSDEAAALAEENGWLLVQVPSATDQVAAGTVIAQTPPSGTAMLSGSALVVSVATAPDPLPEPDAETVFDADGTGSGTTDAAQLAGGTRHVLAYAFTGEGNHTVTVVDAEGHEVAVLVDVNGTTEGATGLPLAGSYRLQVDTADGVEWTLRVVALS